MASKSTPSPSPPSSPMSSSENSISWKEKFLVPTVLAGVVGGIAGLVSKYRQVHDVGNICATYATNLSIVAGCYCGAREFVRKTRLSGPDDLLNSVGGGIMSGAILGRLQDSVHARLQVKYQMNSAGGQLGAGRYAIIFAAAGTAIDYATLRLQPVVVRKYNDFSLPEWSLPEWSPIQVLDEEALAAKRAAVWQKNLT